jgi:hypothetical protein
MSKGEQPRASMSVPSKACLRSARPPRGDFSFKDFSHAPSPENLPKNGFCPLKGGVAFLTETVFEKNFQVPERVPLSALVPAHMAAPLPGEAARGLTGSVTPHASGSRPTAR